MIRIHSERGNPDKWKLREITHPNAIHQPHFQTFFPTHYAAACDPEITGTFTISVTQKRCAPPVRAMAYQYESDDTRVTISGYRKEQTRHIVENPAYTLMLDGYFYLDSSISMSVEINLKMLMKKISLSTIENGLHQIAGGVFSLVILDKQRNRLLITGDRFGLMPMYYFENKTGFHLSGNPFAFRKLTSISEESLVEFLKYGYLPFSHSLFENVKRLQPGQMLSVSLETQAVQASAARVPEFKPLKFRIQNLQEAAIGIHEAFKRYFSRFSPADYYFELQNDYSTRLLALWLKDFSPKIFGDKGRRAEKFANKSGLEMVDAMLPSNRLETHFGQLGNRSRLIVSLEHAKFFGVDEHLRQVKNGFWLDEFIGDAAMGANFFSKPKGDWRNRQKHGREKATANTSIRKIQYYQQFIYNDINAVPDSELTGILSPAFESWFLNAAQGILEINRNAGHTHEDFIESLRNYTQSRNLTAARMINISEHSLFATPFADYEIVERCQNIDKSLRYNNGYYHYYLRAFFPESRRLFGNFFEENPWDSPRRFRLKKVLRHVAARQKRDNQQRALEIRLNQPESLAFIQEKLDNPAAEIPGFIPENIASLHRGKKLNKLLLMRYISLNGYLSF